MVCWQPLVTYGVATFCVVQRQRRRRMGTPKASIVHPGPKTPSVPGALRGRFARRRCSRSEKGEYSCCSECAGRGGREPWGASAGRAVEKWPPERDQEGTT